MRISDWSSDVCSSDLSPVTEMLTIAGITGFNIGASDGTPPCTGSCWFVGVAGISARAGVGADDIMNAAARIDADTASGATSLTTNSLDIEKISDHAATGSGG